MGRGVWRAIVHRVAKSWTQQATEPACTHSQKKKKKKKKNKNIHEEFEASETYATSALNTVQHLARIIQRQQLKTYLP